MRKARKIVPGANYHVTAQVNRKEYILNSTQVKKLFLLIIKRAKQKYRFKVKNFCIMGNHVHLLICPQEKESLSNIMQWILATFAINYNKIFGLRGHVWYDRFHSRVLESYRQYLITFEYIVNNPVKAELVQSPGEYRFGGLWYLRKGLYEIIEPPDDFIMIKFPELTAINRYGG